MPVLAIMQLVLQLTPSAIDLINKLIQHYENGSQPPDAILKELEVLSASLTPMREK